MSLLDFESSGASLEYGLSTVTKSGAGLAGRRVISQGFWMTQQTEQIQKHLPDVLSIEWNETSARMTMAKSPYKNFMETIVSNEISKTKATKHLVHITRWIERNIHSHKSKLQTSSWDYVFAKTRQRLTSIPAEYSSILSHIIGSDKVTVNGRVIPGLLTTIKRLDSSFKKTLGKPEQLALVHGDFHTGNILINENDFLVIDPRGDFDDFESNFDFCYDFGKMFHDIQAGYSLIKSGEYEVRGDFDNIVMKFPNTPAFQTYRQLNASFSHYLLNNPIYNRTHILKSSIYGGLLIVGAIPFHLQSHKRVIGMALSGLLSLNRSFEGMAHSDRLENLLNETSYGEVI